VEVLPPVRTARFEQLEPGELFIYMDGSHTFYALKTQPPATGDKSTMVVLGPSFPEHLNESFLLPWQPATVLSLGKDFSVLPSLDPALWSLQGPSRDPVCLAVADGSVYICTNGGHSPTHYFACFVEMATGAIVEGRLSGHAVFTVAWEIMLLSASHPPRSILKYPLH
jgi:hypothetical protein